MKSKRDPAARSMMKRVYDVFLVLVLAGFFYPALCHAHSSVAGFIRETPLPESVRERLVARTAVDMELSSWVIEEDGIVYSLVFLPTPAEENLQARKKVEVSLLSAADMRGKMNLLLYGTSSLYPREIYVYPEAIAGALISLRVSKSESGFLLPGSQDSRSILEDGVASLTWVPLESILVTGQNLPQGKLFDDAYCTQLYGISRSYFNTGKYEQALGMLREMHRFQWMNPDAYLDAAECFIRLGNPGDGRVMLERTIAAMGDAFSVDQLERAGELFGEAGDEASMQKLYEKALKLFRSQRGGRF